MYTALTRKAKIPVNFVSGAFLFELGQGKRGENMDASDGSVMNRRGFLQRAAVGALALASVRRAAADATDLKAIQSEIEKRHDEAVHRIQGWIQQPSIAAENRGVSECCDLTMRLLREAGFGQVARVPTDGQPGIFATLDAGAPRTIGIYFMYDVKQVDPAEWSSPPWEARLVEKSGLGKVLMGRGAVNTKGPQGASRRCTRSEAPAASCR